MRSGFKDAAAVVGGLHCLLGRCLWAPVTTVVHLVHVCNRKRPPNHIYRRQATLLVFMNLHINDLGILSLVQLHFRLILIILLLIIDSVVAM